MPRFSKFIFLTIQAAFAQAIFAQVVFAVAPSAETPSKVVDLGELSVNGEVRRPNITWIDSQKLVNEALPGVVKAEIELFESRLLEPDLPHGEQRELPKQNE